MKEEWRRGGKEVIRRSGLKPSERWHTLTEATAENAIDNNNNTKMRLIGVCEAIAIGDVSAAHRLAQCSELDVLAVPLETTNDSLSPNLPSFCFSPLHIS